MFASTTAHTTPATSEASYSLAPLWRDVRAELRSHRQDRHLRAAPQRHLRLVASNGELVAPPAAPRASTPTAGTPTVD